ncbi:hypothetical protein MHI57_24825 [Cytobacillus sp. FSL K6-0129]|uniref:hypothetical protein n=1 Tax=Cytobacillus sp. FSL K6-0129 TaxID=2921421 RepID=UPI0030F9A1FD
METKIAYETVIKDQLKQLKEEGRWVFSLEEESSIIQSLMEDSHFQRRIESATEEFLERNLSNVY